MATTNPFDLLGDDDNDDPIQLIAAQHHKLPPPPPPPNKAPETAKPTAKLPSKPLPPAQAVREGKNERARGQGRGGGRGFGCGRANRDLANNENSFSSNNGFSGGYKPTEGGGDAGKPSERRGYGGLHGGHRGIFSNGEVTEGEHHRRTYECHSGTGRGNAIKRDGAGHGNWGTPTDEIVLETEEPINEYEKNVDAEKKLGQEDAGDTTKENPVNEPEEKEPEDKEMTLEEYEKVLEEKRKALLALKSEERKVVVDNDFESMQLLSSKKIDDDILLKLGSDKDKRKVAAEKEEKAKRGSDKDKRKDAAEKEEKAKRSVSINQFLKPAEGERYYGPGRRGRGHCRVPRGGFGGSNIMNTMAAPSINDVGQFPSLRAK